MPAPVLIKSPPPDTPPANNSVRPVATSTRPDCANVMAREVMNEFETASPPPSNTTAPVNPPTLTAAKSPLMPLAESMGTASSWLSSAMPLENDTKRTVHEALLFCRRPQGNEPGREGDQGRSQRSDGRLITIRKAIRNIAYH
ncbi:hypothetical protein GCM10008164_46450 [Achromobacter xylosoxidans]|nr:hypothetical protein GCM10008164_46450 [Achromobacter xylosoxidans]